MMFVDDMILIDENTNLLEGKLERWWKVLKKNKLKISTVKKEFSNFKFKNKVERNRSDPKSEVNLLL